MKRILIIQTVIMALASSAVFGQTACTVTAPCVAVKITAAAYTAGMTTTLYKCQGSATSCSVAALTAIIATPDPNSPWELVTPQPFPQTAATTVYNDPEPYGGLINYAASNTTVGGAATLVSGILVFQMPQAPSQIGPSLSTSGMATSGNTGPQ